MSITRKFLEGMGLNAEAVEAIVEANSQSLAAIKAERDTLKSENERLTGELKSKQESYEAEISKLRKEYDDFKSETDAKAVKAEKQKLYSDLLIDSNIPQNRVQAILRLTDFDKIEIEDGKLKGVKELKAGIEKEWSDYIMKGSQQDDKPPHPPAKGEVSPMSKEAIFAIKDPVERVNKIKENIDLFQKQGVN